MRRTAGCAVACGKPWRHRDRYFSRPEWRRPCPLHQRGLPHLPPARAAWPQTGGRRRTRSPPVQRHARVHRRPCRACPQLQFRAGQVDDRFVQQLEPRAARAQPAQRGGADVQRRGASHSYRRVSAPQAGTAAPEIEAKTGAKGAPMSEGIRVARWMMRLANANDSHFADKMSPLAPTLCSTCVRRFECPTPSP